MLDTPNDESIFHYGSQERRVRFELGSLYRVEPMNPLKQEGRGRLCQLLELSSIDKIHVVVRYADTGRQGRVDPADLTPFDTDEHWTL